MVNALFDNVADGEVARHIPRVWDTVSPEAALAAREQARSPRCGVARAADLVTKAGTSAPTEGRALDAAVRALPLPTEPAARL